MQTSEPIPAAQYLRMSTEHQQYSLANQAAAISDYARLNGFDVIRTYEDAGKSGLFFRQRKGLCSLLNDVIQGVPSFRAVLVYDVSRWGRFQDSDEAAHYEFLCRRAGVQVHYCAEQFANDGSIPSSIMKALKRTMAAEYSRELSAKVYEGKKRLVLMGFRAGGVVGYGLRRMLVSTTGQRKQLLETGERKSISTDRVILVPGPEEEIRWVRHIFAMALRGKTTACILRDLERRGVPWVDGEPWTWEAVAQVLRNPKYVGCNEWGLTDQKLGARPIRNPAEKRITAAHSFTPIIDQKLFDRVQAIHKRNRRSKSNAEILRTLRKLLSRKGYLSQSLIARSRSVPGASLYRTRFGGIRETYARIGYAGNPIYLERADRAKNTRRMQQELIQRVVAMRPESFSITIAQRRAWHPMLIVDSRIQLSVYVCPSRQTKEGRRYWVVTPVRWERPFMALLCLQNRDNDDFRRFYLFLRITLSARLSFTKKGKFLARGTRLGDLGELYSAVLAMDKALTNSAPMPRKAAAATILRPEWSSPCLPVQAPST